MKTAIRTTLVSLTCLFAMQLPATAGNDKPISVSQLPAAALQLIKKTFPEQEGGVSKDGERLFRP